jgi:hypothetical protein
MYEKYYRDRGGRDARDFPSPLRFWEKVKIEKSVYQILT